MAFQVSPGVQVKEIDATAVVPAVSTSIGGFAGSFNWGPVDQVVNVSSEQVLTLTTWSTGPQLKAIQDDMLPFGIINDGQIEDKGEGDGEGNVWFEEDTKSTGLW
jgi:hypothetical protein